MKRNTTFAVAGFLVLILVIGGYFTFGVWQKHAQQRRLAALLQDTTEQLEQALTARPSPELVKRIDSNLHAAKAPRDPGLADAAELYILGAREIARRRVEVDRLARQASASRQSLAGHMAGARRRNDGWFRDAMELKRRVERDHFELGITLKALDELLYTLPESEKRLADEVGPALLLAENVRQVARKRAQEEARRASAALEQARRLDIR